MSYKDMTIQEVQDEIIEEFSMFDDWMDRYDHLIEEGKSLPVIDEKYKKNDYLIDGCQSRVWLYPELIKVLSGRTPDEIIDSDLYFIDRVGLSQNLSPTRSNGLMAMLKQMKMYALAFKAKQQH
jgi:cysteine desulfuration protein SufE